MRDNHTLSYSTQWAGETFLENREVFEEVVAIPHKTNSTIRQGAFQYVGRSVFLPITVSANLYRERLAVSLYERSDIAPILGKV